MMKASDIFVASLEHHGVRQIFAVPGEENLDLVQSLKGSSIEMIVTRNEQTAVFMAATYGRLTGKPGVALATLGPGATNMMTGVAYAQLGGMPVIIITGQKPIRTSKQGRFQVIDVVSMMKPITKYAYTIVDGARISSTLAHAFQLATQERPGAIHIELPEDIAGHDVPSQYATPISSGKIRRPEIDEKQLTQLVDLLQDAKRPMILVGAGANRKRITNYLTKFITKHNIPFFASQMGKGVVDERLPQYIGTAALTSGDHLHPVIEQADLILAVGHDVIEKPTNIIEQGNTKVIHINFTPAEIDMLYAPSLQVIGDIGNTFWQLFEASIDTSGWDFTSLYELYQQQYTQKITYEQTLINDEVMTPPSLVNIVRKALDDDDILTLDNGLYKVWFARNYETRLPNTLLLDNALATMGAGYSSGMMAKLLYPTKRVISVTGDGGLVMNLGDLATAVKNNIDMTIIVLNDNAYGMIKWKQINHDFDDRGLDLHNPDFVQLANSFGAVGHRINTPDELAPLLADTETIPGVHIIEVPFQYPKKFFIAS